MFALMVLKELYRSFLLRLQNIYSLGEATTITNWAFEKIANIKRSDIIKDPAQPLNPSTLKLLNDALAQLLEHKPIQYVLGEAWFYNMQFKVNEQVLIPRPETEELVEMVLEACKNKLTDIFILDIGTGSGCIPVIVKKHLPASKIMALDISSEALKVAKENALHYHTDIEFKVFDFLNEKKWDELPVFDIIVSNPPYIPLNEKAGLDKHVANNEPHTALFVPDNEPLLFYNKIADFSRQHLADGGCIFMEAHENHDKEVEAVFSKQYENVIVKKDINGKNRIVMAC